MGSIWDEFVRELMQTLVTVAKSRIVVNVANVPAGSDAVVSLQLDLLNTRGTLKQTVLLRASANFKDGIGSGYTTSNSASFIFGDEDLSDGVTAGPRLLPVTTGFPTVHMGPRATDGFNVHAFQAKEPVAVYIVPPNGASPVLAAGSYAASSSGLASLRVNLSSFSTTGIYRIVVVGGWSGAVGVGQVSLIP